MADTHRSTGDQPVILIVDDDEIIRKMLSVLLRKFQNLNHPKNHEYDGEINETWDNYFSGTALSWQSA